MGKQYNVQFTVFADKELVSEMCIVASNQMGSRLGWRCGYDKNAARISVQTPESLSNWSYGVNMSIKIVPSTTKSQTTVSVMTECRQRYGFIKGRGESSGEAEKVAKTFLGAAWLLLKNNAIQFGPPKEFRSEDLEEMLSRKPSPQEAVQAGDAEFQGATASDAVPENRKDAELQSQAVPAQQKKTVVGFAKAWIIFWIIGNLAATCAPINQLTIPGASGITAIVMLLSGAIAAGYIMLYNKNPFGLYLVLIANLLALSMNSPYTLVKTGLIPGIITFFITYKQIDYPFGKPAVTKANLNPTTSDNPVISRQQNTTPDMIVPQVVPVSKPALVVATFTSPPLPETQTPAPSDPSNLKECLACHKQVENLQQTCPYCGGAAFVQAGAGNDSLSLLDSMQKQAEAAEHVDRGAQLIMQRHYAEAESELKKAIEINPLNATAHSNMGGVFLRQGQPEKAIPWLEKALELNPQLGGVAQALAQARSAARIKPPSTLSKTKLGLGCAVAGLFLGAVMLTICGLAALAVKMTAPVSTSHSDGFKQQVAPLDGMTLVYVPASEFQMGSDDDPGNQVHTIYLDAFWIDQTEVTNEMYAKCISTGTCQAIVPLPEEKFYGNHQPAVFVDWDRANAYCTWAGRRLPTEAEWEKAARGTDGRAYPWGDQPRNPQLLNYNNNVEKTSDVGSYPAGASPYGALDMEGNVSEWVADWYDSNYYSNSPARNPQGPSSGSEKVMRGGAWDESDLYPYASSFRGYDGPMGSGYRFGFRCATSLPLSPSEAMVTAATETPAPAGSLSLKPGHWTNEVGTEGFTNVSFDLADDGNISNFTMVASIGTPQQECTIKIDQLQMQVNKDGTFLISHFMTYADLSEQVGPAVMSIVAIPTGQPYEVLHISGNTTDTSMDGTYKIGVCGTTLYFGQNTGPWKAQWKKP